MHIVGLAKDQTGKEYYIVKNSWGITNDYKGYLYVTKEFVRYKTTSLLVHKDGTQTQSYLNYRRLYQMHNLWRMLYFCRWSHF
jgi:C1A family cysteine protease